MKAWFALGAVLAASCGRIGFAPARVGSDGAVSDASSADAMPGIRVLAHTIVNTDGATLTTAAIDTTGASLIVMAECTWSTGAPLPPNDSEANTWQTGLLAYGADTAPANIKMFYAYAPITSATHTFTDPGNDFLSIAVIAASGTRTTAAVLDTATGATGPVPLAPGAVTPSQAGELVITFGCSGESVATAISIDDGFAVADTVLNGAASAPEDMASAYAISTSVTPVQPRWTFSGDTRVTGTIAAFAHP